MDIQERVEREIRTQYGSVAESGLSSAQSGVRAVAEAFGYSATELASIPAEANMGLSCGNPTAYTSLRAGEVVVDLGCGGGMDVFLASQKVGPTGRAIGIDMTPHMLALAEANAARGIDGKPFTNVEFVAGRIDDLPLDAGCADVVISNCVINLAVDKGAVFREIFRVLKPGGRVAVSDIALKKSLPPELGADLSAYVGCIAGAILIEDYRRGLIDAGFADVLVNDTGADLSAYSKVEGQSGCCSPAMSSSMPKPTTSGCCGGAQAETSVSNAIHGRLTALSRQYDLNDFAASVRIYALKPGDRQ